MNEQERNQNGYNGEITEESPSRSEYFSWINNTNEGSTEAQTLANLAFFAELNKKYGMRLDIYEIRRKRRKNGEIFLFRCAAIIGSVCLNSIRCAGYCAKIKRKNLQGRCGNAESIRPI